MSKKYTAAELKGLLAQVVQLAILHIDSIQKKINEIRTDTDESKKDENLQNIHRLEVILISINHIIHPAFNYCKSIYKEHKEFFDQLEKNQEHALKSSFFPPCTCDICKKFVESLPKEDINQ